MRQKIFLVSIGMVIAIALQSAAFSAAKTFFIKGSGIHRGATTALLTEINNTNYQFFLTRGASTNPLTLTLPSSTTPITDFKVQSGTVWAPGTPPPPQGRNVQAECYIGDTLSAIIWTTGVGRGNYYGRASLAMTSDKWGDETLAWNWNNLAVNWKAAAPHTPVITGFEEATTFDAADAVTGSNVKILSGAGSGTDPYDLREVTAYRWKMWTGATESTTYLADGPGAGISGSGTATLQLTTPAITAGTTYNFKVEYRSAWGDTLSSQASHTVAGTGGPGGGPITKTWTLLKTTTGINTFALPFNPLSGVTAGGSAVDISTVEKLIKEINRQAGGQKVKVFGWFDSATQTHKGLTSINYNADGTIDTAAGASTATGGTVAAIKDAPTAMDTAYQVSVDSVPAAFTLSGTR